MGLMHPGLFQQVEKEADEVVVVEEEAEGEEEVEEAEGGLGEKG